MFTDAAQSGTTWSTRDRIRDFSQSDGDLIDLSGIDAGSGGGDQAFLFVGGAAFSSTEGEVRFVQKHGNTFIQGDFDGDGVADFEVCLDGPHFMGAGDFVL